MRLFQVVWDYVRGSILTTKGDIFKQGAAATERLPVGTAEHVLRVNTAGDDLEYSDTYKMLTTQGDIAKRGGAATARLPVGLPYQVLMVNDGGDDVRYEYVVRVFGYGVDNVLSLKILEIGTWDMDSDPSKTIAHGLTLAKIRNLCAVIRIDGDASRTMLNAAGYCSADVNNIILARNDGEKFDHVDYHLLGGDNNRGWVTIWYEI